MFSSPGIVSLSKNESYKYQIISKYLGGELKRFEASKLLQMSERSVTRIGQKVKAKGAFGIKHGNLGRKPVIAYPDELKATVLDLFKKKYFDFNLVHFCEVLKQDYDISIPYQTLYTWFKASKFIKNPKVRRRKKRVYRARMPQEGLLLQMDGSHHKFNGKDVWCLIAAIDDATSDIPYAEFFGNGETTLNCMKILQGIILRKGVPKAIYTDKAGWAGGGKRSEFSQFQRACEKLGIQLIFADSPEAKGRIERTFRTIQDRLIPELRLNKIKTLKKANGYLMKEFIGKYWKKSNIVRAQDSEIAYSPLDPWTELDQVLCLEEDRIIGRDQTVSWQGSRYIVEDGRHSLAGYMAVFRTDLRGKTKVFVHEREVQIKPISSCPESRKIAQKIELDPLLYIKMHRLVTEVNNAVKKHRVTGKPLKLGRKVA